MTRVKKTIAAVFIVALAWVAVMSVTAWYLAERRAPSEPGGAGGNTSAQDLLMARTAERLAALDQTGRLITKTYLDEGGKSRFVLYYEAFASEGVILAEKTVEDLWSGLDSIRYTIERPDTGPRVRMTASIGTVPALQVLIDRTEMSVTPGQKPPKKPVAGPAENPYPKDIAPSGKPAFAKSQLANYRGKGGRIAIVIDDIGYDLDALQKLLDAPAPITFAILPYSPHARESAEMIAGTGKQIMLHMPMEPGNYPENDPGRGALLLGMSADEVRKRVEDALALVPLAAGVNNHMGSAFTARESGMDAVMEVLRRHDLFFLDSRTGTDTVGFTRAREAGVRAAERRVFLDHTLNPLDIQARLLETARAADQEGFAVAIGHPRPETVAVLVEMIPIMVGNGCSFVYASEVAR